MNQIQTAFVLLVVAIAIVAFKPRFKMPVEVLLVLGSLLLSFIPGLPAISVRPDVVFLVFLPPILFAAAYFTSWRDFKANTRPIALLAIGLVLFTTLAVAAVVKWFIPTMPWSVAFILGAMISPPDASAATAIIRKLGVPRRLVTVIEGESLVNDATAIVCYKFAVAATLTGVFSLKMALLKFVWVGAGGVVSGLLMGWIGIKLMGWIEETTPRTLITFLTAFAAYVFGEELGVSGVISTVVAGLYFGRWVPTHGTAEGRVGAQSAWDLFLFVINAFVFTLIGFQLPQVLRHLNGYSAQQLVLYATTVSLVVVVVRFMWVYPATYLPRILSANLRKRDPCPSWKAVWVLSWTAMRGIVTLAAALSLPSELSDGSPFPYRDLLIFLSYAVILTTLLVPALTLPKILVWLGLESGQERYKEEMRARLSMVESVMNSFEDLEKTPGYLSHHLLEIKQRYEKRLEILKANVSDSAFSPLFDEDTQRRRLMRDAITREREALVRLREANQMHDEVFHQINRELDLEDLRLRTQRL